MMFEDVFVDSSAWIALADKGDSHHKEAASSYPSIFKNHRNLVTSNLVIAETYIVLLKELTHKAATEFLERIKASPRILRICSNEDIETEAEGILAKYSDQDFSYADAVGFVIMKRQKIRKSFCFDKHFVTVGFINIP
jgi:predicted nucleic acid-binding protein